MPPPSYVYSAEYAQHHETFSYTRMPPSFSASSSQYGPSSRSHNPFCDSSYIPAPHDDHFLGRDTQQWSQQPEGGNIATSTIVLFSLIHLNKQTIYLLTPVHSRSVTQAPCTALLPQLSTPQWIMQKITTAGGQAKCLSCKCIINKGDLCVRAKCTLHFTDQSGEQREATQEKYVCPNRESCYKKIRNVVCPPFVGRILRRQDVAATLTVAEHTAVRTSGLSLVIA